MSYKFLANVIIKGKIKCLTGLHIGGAVEGYEIGGMDNPIIKHPITGYPYIPGSSIRGKMRSLLEWATEGKITDGDVHHCKDSKCPICRLFGTPAEEERKIGPTRLLVRDAWPTDDEKDKDGKLVKKGTKTILDELQKEKGLPKAEWKWENVINRITSNAVPRQIERIPRDSEFDFEMIYGIYNTEDEGYTDIEYLKYIFEAIELLKDSVLGGYGSRGSGQIEIQIKDMKLKRIEDYEKKGKGQPISVVNYAQEIREKLSQPKEQNENNISKT